MKKTLALVLALAMVFSTITVAFAEGTLGEDAQICADLGMLKGETGTVDAAYVATAPTRLQAAVMFLRLKGLEAEALAFTGEENFADGNIAWAEGANLLAYLKANPQLGWIGDGVSFNPTGVMTAQAYYKVLLEALGYKQTTAEVAGDFAWEEVLTFAASVGLSKVADVENFTVNDLAVATVEALKINVKGTEEALYKSLVTEEAAVAAGLVEAAPAAVAAELKEAKATGEAVVEVTFKTAVDEAAENVANYAIEGLEVNSAAISGTKTVILGTAKMTSGKVYKLTVGEKTVQFTGIAKVSGGPEISSVKSEDVEEVVITFNKNIDLATGTDIANYSIAGVEIVKAEVDEAKVTLTTDGLKNKTKYTVKVTNIKSVDGVSKKSDSDTFTVKYDLLAPKIKAVSTTETVEVQTNERIVVYFTEEVDQATAEDLANYSIKVDETDGAELEIISITWDDDDEDNVEIVTEPMEKREDYKLTVNNIADQRKVPNVMTRPATAKFKGAAEDENAPTWKSITVLSPTTILVEYNDASKIDEDSALDLNNYELEDLDIESIKTVKNEWKVFRALLTVEEMETGKNYKLTIADILDEFGNAMKSNYKTAKGISGSFASAKLITAEATGENAVTLEFDKEVDEATAENLANYSINKEVGAPTKATLQDDGVTVKLETNDLVNGRGYKITVDGVEDLAGNVLYYKMDLDTTTNEWDTTAPELEDAEILNEFVVALSFDEMVEPAADAELILKVDDDGDGDYDENVTVALDYFDVVDDDTVVEFSGPALDPTKRYTVVNIVYNTSVDGGIRDLIGNPVLATTITLGEFEFDGVDDPYEDRAEVDSYEQVDAKTFEVTMSRDVMVYDPATNLEVPNYVVNGFTVSVSPDDDFVLLFVKNSGIIDEEDDDYAFDLRDFVMDYHGMDAANADEEDVTYLAPEYTDEDAPEVDEVVAKNRKVVKVVFNEDLSAFTAGKFALKNVDLDKTVSISSVAFDPDNDNVVLITLSTAMEARYEYELTIEKGAVADYVPLEFGDGEVASYDETWYFNGTNLAD
jgi:hypothetical protein